MRVFTAAAAVLAMAASGFAATLKVPQQYGTIQEAVDAASDGDTIKISAGVYRENVSAGEKTGLRFLGKNVVWDGNLAGDQGACLSAFNAGGFLIQGIRFRNGFPCLNLEGDGITIQKCSFQNAWDWALDLSGNGLVFQKNTVLSSYRGVRVSPGDDALFSKNRFLRVYATHVVVFGNRAALNGGLHTGFDEENDVVNVQGDDAAITRNSMRDCSGLMIGVSGDRATVQGNTLGRGYAGILVYGEDGLVADNRVRSFLYYPIHIDGTGIVVRGNDAGISRYAALILFGNGHQVLDNTLSDATNDQGISATGNGLLIQGNTISGCQAGGIASYGDGVSIRDNRVADVWGGDGIYASGSAGIVVSGNVVADCLRSGISVSGTAMEISGNTVTGSGSYYYSAYDLGVSGSTISGNTADGAGYRGFDVGGDGNALEDCEAKGSAIDGIYVSGSGNTLTNCSASGSGGQGLWNGGTNTTVTGSTFLGNAMDLANTGTFLGGTAGIEFESGGAAQVPQFYPYL